jgi:hypothetical protein
MDNYPNLIRCYSNYFPNCNFRGKNNIKKVKWIFFNKV